MKNKKRKVYSEKQRKEAVGLHRKGKSLGYAAKKIGCHKNTVYRWVNQYCYGDWQGENPEFIKDEWPDHTLNRAPFIEDKFSDTQIMKDAKSRARKYASLKKVPGTKKMSIVDYEEKPVDLEEHTKLHRDADEFKKSEKHEELIKENNRLLRKASSFIKENLKLKKENGILKRLVAENIIEKELADKNEC